MLNTLTQDESVPLGAGVQSTEARRVIWLTAVCAALYPWVLDAFHWAVTPGAADQPVSAGSTAMATLMLVVAFAVPLICLLQAGHPLRAGAGEASRARRFAFIAMTAPTTYVFFGVVSYMAGSPIPDTWIWTPAWLLLGYVAIRKGVSQAPGRASLSAPLRVAHGVCGAIAALYVLFHITNHLFGLVSPQAHGAVMDIGRTVYRASFIEPLLVMVMLFQIVSGLRLVWTGSETTLDRYRVFQLSSGVFMSVFILGHMNSVFIFARTYLGIPTDWAFAAGLPTGLIADPWNIRLLPHYALGVFFVLAHLFSGLRVVLLAHGVKPTIANTLWWVGAGVGSLVSLAIMLGMTGFRLV
ncbi:hypothetical protein HNO86_19655 [Pseudomonas sp. C1C7]|uniref:hypothetical protein n=1 Tax=Pseudomonas sp. C1C7 TaxID=2735272 RepID=UPI0015868AF1|nr:hypothetical protein [Pseudomonas sp. C1C7]NUT77264.1 hypothetical protein [Pseudomonas sp. C1C7]